MSTVGEQIAKNVRFCSVGGCPVDLAYEAFGSPSDPALLLVMGLGGQMISWDSDLCVLLARTGPFYVVRFDNRDVGLSTKFDHLGLPGVMEMTVPYLNCTGKRYGLGDMALDAVALLDYLGIRRAHLFGLSMGGMIAQLLATDHPSRVLSLTSMMSTTGGWGLPRPALSILLNLLKKPKSSSVEDLVDFGTKMAKAILVVGTTTTPDAYIVRNATRGAQRTTYRRGVRRQTIAILLAPSREPKLRRLTIPTVVIHGSLDQLVPPGCGERTAAVIPGSRLVVIEGMGHYPSPCYFERIAQEVGRVAKMSSSL